MKFTSQVDMLFAYWNMGLGSTEHALNSKAVQNFIQNDKSKFDLVISEQFFQEAFLMFAHKYKAPIVTISEIFGEIIVRLTL
jgi:glucuronosyltransferase